MRVLVTGAKGFVGRNLVESLKAIRDGKDRRVRYSKLQPLTIFECDLDTTREELSLYCSEADFVFNLAGVNRPEDPAEFMQGNFGFASELLGLLEHHGNRSPVMLASSAQASLEGRYAGSAYGESKLAGEGLFFEYSDRTGAPVLVYRFPNLYGKWCRPRYNSAVATFCDAIANGRPYEVSDPSVELELRRRPGRGNARRAPGGGAPLRLRRPRARARPRGEVLLLPDDGPCDAGPDHRDARVVQA